MALYAASGSNRGQPAARCGRVAVNPRLCRRPARASSSASSSAATRCAAPVLPAPWHAQALQSLATRSSKMPSSLSHWVALAQARCQVAHALGGLLISPAASRLGCSAWPSRTRASKTLPPSCCAWQTRPARPARPAAPDYGAMRGRSWAGLGLRCRRLQGLRAMLLPWCDAAIVDNCRGMGIGRWP